MVSNATGKPPIKVGISESKHRYKSNLWSGWIKGRSCNKPTNKQSKRNHCCRWVHGRSSNAQLQAVKMWGCSPVLQVTTVAFDQKKCTFVFPHPGHLEERSRCLDFFLKLYGDPSPLRQVAVDCCVGSSQWYIPGPIQSWSCPLQRQPSRCNEKVQWHGEPVISCQVNGCDDQEVPNNTL